jgi:hypothetical protein
MQRPSEKEESISGEQLDKQMVQYYLFLDLVELSLVLIRKRLCFVQMFVYKNAETFLGEVQL